MPSRSEGPVPPTGTTGSRETFEWLLAARGGRQVAAGLAVALIGPAGSDWELLAAGIRLQAELGVPDPYAAR